MKTRSKRSTRSSTSLRQRSIDEVFRTSKASNAERAQLDALKKAATTATAGADTGTPVKPVLAQPPTDIVVVPDAATKGRARSSKAGARRQLTLADLSGVDSHARKPRQKAKGKSKARRSASASASAPNGKEQLALPEEAEAAAAGAGARTRPSRSRSPTSSTRTSSRLTAKRKSSRLAGGDVAPMSDSPDVPTRSPRKRRGAGAKRPQQQQLQKETDEKESAADEDEREQTRRTKRRRLSTSSSSDFEATGGATKAAAGAEPAAGKATAAARSFQQTTLLSHLRSRKDTSNTSSAHAKVTDYEVAGSPEDTDDFAEPVASPRKSPAAGGKRKTPSKSTRRSRTRVPRGGEAGEVGQQQQEGDLTSDSDSGAGGEAGAEADDSAQPEAGGLALSPKPRKSSTRTTKGSPKKKLKSTPAPTELTQPEPPLAQVIEAEYVPSPLRVRSKRATRTVRAQSTPMTQTQGEETEEEPGARRQRPIRSRHSRLVRLGSGASARSRSPVGDGGSAPSSSDSDSDGAITVGAKTPRRGVRAARKNQVEGRERERDVAPREEGGSDVSETDRNSSKKAGSLPSEDNLDILFDGVSSEIVVPEDVLAPPQAGGKSGAADLDDLDAQIDRQSAENTAKASSQVARAQPGSSSNPVLSAHLDKRLSSPKRRATRHPGWGGSPRVFSPVPLSGAKAKPTSPPRAPPSSSPLRSPLRSSSRGARLAKNNAAKGSPKRKRGAAALQRGRGLFQDASSSQRDLFDPPTSGVSPSMPTTNEGEGDAKANAAAEEEEGATSSLSSLRNRSKSTPAKLGRNQHVVPATPPRGTGARRRAADSPAQVTTPVGASSQFQSPKAPPSARSRLGQFRSGAPPSPSGAADSSFSPSRGRERVARARQLMSSGEHRSDLNRALAASSPSRVSPMREVGSDASLGPARAERRRAMIEGLQAAQKGQLRLFLPSSYNLVIDKFKAMEVFLTINLSRHKSSAPYSDVKTSVETTTRREFSHADLGIIAAVFPEGYELKYIPRTNKRVKWKKDEVLSVVPKNCGIAKRNGEHEVVVRAEDQPVATKMNFMTRDTTFNRRHLFRERLEHHVLEAHQAWLRRNNKGDHNPYVTNMWHPDFPIEKTALPEPVKMPEATKRPPSFRSMSSRSSSVDVLRRSKAHALKAAPPRPASKSVLVPKEPAAASASSSSSSNSGAAIAHTGASKPAAAASGTRSPRKKKRNDGDISCLDPAILEMLQANSAAQKELKDISHYNFRIRHLKEMWTFVRLVSGIMKQKHKTAFSYPELKSLCRKRARGINSEATITTRFNMLFELAGDWCKLVQPGPHSTLKNPIFKIIARPGYNINLIRLTINKAIKETEVERAEAMLK